MKLHLFSRFKFVIAICLVALLVAVPVFAQGLGATINSITRDECVIHINLIVDGGGTYYVQIWDDGDLIDVQAFTASTGETLTVDYIIKKKALPGAPGVGIYITDGPGEFATVFDGDDRYIYPDDVASSCAAQYAGGVCLIDIPAGSVVGDLPFDTQAYWAPGKVPPGVVLKAGTYWVVGEEADDAGNQFYKVVLACQYLYIPADAMQPSFSGPWHGEALPSNAG